MTDPLRTPVHRIIYQSDTQVVTACGVLLTITRKEVEASPYLTIWRGCQTCPDCPDELDEIPDAYKLMMKRGKR